MRVVTDEAIAPGGHFGLQTSVDQDTRSWFEFWEPLRNRAPHFGSGPGASPDAAPFSLTSDGLRYVAAVRMVFFGSNDHVYELPETVELALGSTSGVPAGFRLAGGGGSRLPFVFINTDTAESDITGVVPGDGTLTVTWEHAVGSGPFVEQTELQWRRTGETTWPADGTGLFATGTTAEIPGLDNGVEYEVRARPIMPDGNSGWPVVVFCFHICTGTPRSNLTVPSVGVSAGAAEATEGAALSFAVRAAAPVTAAVDVAVVVAEDANIDTDNDGTADESSGVLPAAQEGRRVVTIPAGASEAVLSVLTAADEAWENHATVTVTVSAPDGETYTVDAAAASASTRVLDDDVPDSEVTWGVSVAPDGEPVEGRALELLEGANEALYVKVRFATDRAEEPHGFFGVRVGVDSGTTHGTLDYFLGPQTLYFGSGDGAPAEAVPFSLSDDGLRYEATATTYVSIVDDDTPELDETFEVALERTPDLPSSVRLGAAATAGVSVTILSDDVAPVAITDVEPGDRTLKVSWVLGVEDSDNYLLGYRVQWWRSDATDPTPEGSRLVIGKTLTTIRGLDNGVPYTVVVRPVGKREISGHPSTHYPGLPDETTATPGVSFRIDDDADDDSPRFARGGQHIQRTVRLVHAGSNASAFAHRFLVPDWSSGPSAAASVRCRARSLAELSGLTDPHESCRTDSDGYLTLIYTAGSFDRDDLVREDKLQLFVDVNGDGVQQAAEPSAELDALGFVRPADLVALGDSFSAGENGEFRAIGGFGPGFDGQFYFTEGAGFECHRWNKAYARLLPTLQSDAYNDVETYACTGAISLNIFDPADENYDGIHDDLGPPLAPQVDPTPDPAVRRTVETNRPSPAAEAYVWPPPADGQDDDWEPRQGLSLQQANTEQTVDMVTLTIGGNDVEFAAVLRSCYVGGCADDLAPARVSALLGEFGDTLGEVFEAVKSAAPHAAVFVLGYPYLTPFSQRDYDAYKDADFAGNGDAYLLVEREACDALNLYPLLQETRLYFVEADSVIDLLNAFANLPDLWRQITALFGGDPFSSTDPPDRVEDAANLLLEIDTLEKKRLRDAVVSLNGLISSRAAAAGVHFVDVQGTSSAHDQCGKDPWLNGLVVDEESSDALPLSGRSFHPTEDGHEAYAAALLDYIATVVERGDPLNAAGLPQNPPPALITATQQASGSTDATGTADRSSDPGEEPQATVENGEHGAVGAPGQPGGCAVWWVLGARRWGGVVCWGVRGGFVGEFLGCGGDGVGRGVARGDDPGGDRERRRPYRGGVDGAGGVGGRGFIDAAGIFPEGDRHRRSRRGVGGVRAGADGGLSRCGAVCG